MAFLSGFTDSLSLKQCYEFAYENYPNAKQITIQKDVADLKVKNVNVNYYPKITFSGQISYQSDVTKIDPGIPVFKPVEPPLDRYKLAIDVVQNIYDGGSTVSLKNIEKSQLISDNRKVEVELFSLKQRINDLFFSTLIYQEKEKVFEIIKGDIQSKMSEAEANVKNGNTPSITLDLILAQLLQIEQEILSAESDRLASLKMLSILIGIPIDTNVNLVIPEAEIFPEQDIITKRPEYEYFNAQKNLFESYKESVFTNSIPKLNIFGQAGFGKPGLNLLEDKWKAFYMIGLNLTWNPFNWNSNKNTLKIYDLNKAFVDIQKETFNNNIRVQLEKYKTDIAKYEELTLKDDEIIDVRNKIVKAVYSQFLNGVVTPTVYLTELNNKHQAMQQQVIHKIQLLQAKVNYLTSAGL